MVLNKYNGSTKMDGTEVSLFKIVGTTMKTFASYIYAKALQAGDMIRLRVYQRVDDVSRWKFDGDVTDSVGGNNGTVTNISSLVSQWKFDGDVNDSIGSNNGTITYNTNLKRLYKFESNLNDSTGGANASLGTGTAIYITGKEGNAFSFNGSTYLTAADTGLPTGTNSWSFSCWIQRTTSPAAIQTFFSYGTAVANQAPIISLDSSYHLNYNSYGNATNVTSSGVLQINTWNFITVTYDGTTIRLYINGVADGSGAYVLGTVLNALNLGQALGNIQRYTGYMDEARFYNITLTAAQVSALYMNGKFAQSHTFDNGEYISKTSPVGIPTGTSDRTVSLWLNPSTITGGTMIFWGAQTTNNAFGVGFDGSGHINAIGWSNDVVSTSVITANVWTHVVVVLSSSGTVRTIYINGVQDKQSTTTALNTSSSTIYTGNRADLGDPYIGQLDEVRVYNTALSASQVLGLYNYTGSNYVTPLPVGNALSLDGSSYVTVTNQTPYNFERTNAFSTSFWIKTTNTSSFTDVISKYQSVSPFQGYIVRCLSTGNIEFYLINNVSTNLIDVKTNGMVNDGNWHNVITTYDGSSTATGVKIYIDGVLQTNTVNSNTLSASILFNTPLVIGASAVGNDFSGLLDEVQIYNYVISAAEIFNINAGRFGNTHPIGLWHFDGDLYDYSGQGSTGSPTGTMTYVTGALSGSYNVPNTHFNFDGSEYVDAGNPSNLNFEWTQACSYAFWIKSVTTDNNINLLVKGVGFRSKGTSIWKGSGDSLLIDIFSAVNTGLESAVVGATGIYDGLWHQVVITYDGSGSWAGVKIYIDSVSKSTSNNGFTSVSGTILNSNNFRICADSAGVNVFEAEIDDLRVYNRALSSAEVSDLYSNPDQGMKELLYDRTVSGVLSTQIYIPTLQGTQYMVTAQQTAGTNRIIAWEREEYQ